MDIRQGDIVEREFSKEDREAAYRSLGHDIKFGTFLAINKVDFNQSYVYKTLWDMKKEKPKVM